MDVFNSVKKNGKDLVSVRAHRGDAMTLLAFDVDESLLEHFVGFSVRVTPDGRKPYFLYNRLSFKPSILKKNDIDEKKKLSSEYSPIQKFRWVHVPSSSHYVDNPFFGIYTYEVTPRYLIDDILQKLDPALTVTLRIEVSPFRDGDITVGFTRSFISSQAYANHFANNGKIRPNQTDLIFDIKQVSGTADRWDPVLEKTVNTPYTFEEQHEYLGWQARDRVMEFLDETINNGLSLDVFAFDLDEPQIVQKLISLAGNGRLRMILDDSADHAEDGCFEEQFEMLFKSAAPDEQAIMRGHYQKLAHSKVFIQRSAAGQAIKVLTGSTNFTTNGLCINANHVIVFNNQTVAELYANVFDQSFSEALMDAFKKSSFAKDDHLISQATLPDMTIRFSPHDKKAADRLFKTVSARIRGAKSDVLFAIMNDRSKSDILDAVREQVKSDEVFTYGITDTAKDVTLYKPHSKRGVRVAGRGTETALPPPFKAVAKVSGKSIHHKFVVVDFKGIDSVVYCGSSNLAYTPEQQNGDNLIEIRDDDVVTVFAIEAIRLVDHFHWRNRKTSAKEKKEPLTLADNKNKKKIWYKSYYDPEDLHYSERTKLVGPKMKAPNQ